MRPGGQDVQAQILWRTRGGAVRVAYLYELCRALPKRIPTPAQRAALAKALAARRTCPRCGHDRGYVLPTRIGACNECATEWETNAA